MASIKDLKRMCKNTNCVNCPFGGEGWQNCKIRSLFRRLPDNADELVDKWISKHPAKTYAMDFFEKFPDAPKDSDGTPRTCWKNVYGDGKYYSSDTCADCTACWNREMKEDG